MSLAAILGGGKKGPTIGGIQVDVSIRETHIHEWQVTEAPIETGGSIADHRARMPVGLDMEGVVSNLPTNLFDLLTQELSAEDRYLELLELAESDDLIEVVTGLRVYQNMTFRRFEVVRDETTGQIIRFRASLRELEFADAEITAVVVNDTDAPKVKPTTKAGPKALPKAEPQAAERGSTILKKGLGKIGGARGIIDSINNNVPRP